MFSPPMNKTNIDGLELELFDSSGSGDPVLFLHSSQDDWYWVIDQPILTENHRVILFHRRGYGRSTHEGLPLTLADHTADARAVLGHLGIERAHVAGLSFGGALVLQMAKDWPDSVHSLVLLEPGLLNHLAEYPQVLETSGKAQSLYDSGDKAGAITVFFEEVCGPNAWEVLPEETFDRLVNNADTVFHSDDPALVQWEFGEDDARAISQPVLNVTGADTRPYFKEIHETVKQWFPQSEDVVIPDSQHSISIIQPERVAEVMVDFLARHRIQPEPRIAD
jgi:pimeloyl-ACP methyl ester carboxylesterase